MSDKIYTVKNRSAGMVVYSIPEDNVRREFAPGEEKRISFRELEKLSFIPGGQALLNQYLQILDSEVIESLNIPTQPEYFMDEKQVKELLINGTMDELLDCLDYAPQGVKDLVKDIAVNLPLKDMRKTDIIKEKLGFDCEAAIKHNQEEKMASTKIEPAAPVATGRRTSGDKYKVIK